MCVLGMVWSGIVWYGMLWCCMVYYGMVQFDMVWYGHLTTVWYGQYGMVWYGRCVFRPHTSMVTARAAGDGSCPLPSPSHIPTLPTLPAIVLFFLHPFSTSPT